MSSLPVASSELPAYSSIITSPLPSYHQQWRNAPASALAIPAAAHGSARDMFAAGPALEAAEPATHIAMSALSNLHSARVAASQTRPIQRTSACLGVAASCLSGTAIGFGMLVAMAIFPGSLIAGAALTLNGIIEGRDTLLKAGIPLLTLGLLIGIGIKKVN